MRVSHMKVLITILVLLLLVLQYQLWFGKRGLREVWQLAQSVEMQKQENRLIKQRNEGLAAEVKDLKEGREAIEERARNDLGMIRRGETFYQVVEEQK